MPRLLGSHIWSILAGVGCLVGAAHSATARVLIDPGPATPSVACQAAIVVTEQQLGIARGLLGAIGIAETGRFDPALGRVAPWPWSINVAGEDHVFASKAEAIDAVRAYQAQGVRSIDVGCVQVNLMYHPTAFASLDEAFEPTTNVAYGGRFLRALYATAGDWSLAAGFYHSQTPELAEPYRQRVVLLWTGVKAAPMPAAAAALNTNADVYGSWPPTGTAFGAMPPAGYAFRCCNGTTQPRTGGTEAAPSRTPGHTAPARPLADTRPPTPSVRPQLAQSGTLLIAAPTPVQQPGSTVAVSARSASAGRVTRVASR